MPTHVLTWSPFWILTLTSAEDKYHLKCRKHLDTFIEVVPDYLTRIRDEIAVQPDQLAFNNAYKLLQLPSLTSKTQLHFPTYNTLDLSNMSKPQTFCCSSKKSTSPDVNPEFDNHATIPVMPWQVFPIPCQHYPALLMHYPAHSAPHIGLHNYRTTQQNMQWIIINIPYHVQNSKNYPLHTQSCVSACDTPPPLGSLGVLPTLTVPVGNACAGGGGPPV
jgi:hypothetical protein